MVRFALHLGSDEYNTFFFGLPSSSKTRTLSQQERALSPKKDAPNRIQ
jgi:hypothetical protein